MPMYARLWVDILDDPKLMRAAREGAKNIELLPWFIAFAKRADADGRIEIAGKPADPRDIARSIPNAKSRRVAKSLSELHGIGVLSQDVDGCYRFVAWDFRNAGKTSDSREAIADRVRKHRERKRAGGNAAGNTRNALQALPDVTDVTSKRVESREEREESREKRDTAGSSKKDSLPAGALEFGRTFYRAAPRARQLEIQQQLLATLNGGAKLRRGVKVRALSIEHLERRCREVIAEGVKNPDKAIVVLLTKLNDVGNAQDSPTERANRVEREAEKRDEADTARRLARAIAWLEAEPEIAAAIDAAIAKDLPADAMQPIVAVYRQGLVLKAWSDAGEPTVQPTGSP